MKIPDRSFGRIGCCETCGKVSYLSRKIARAFGRRLYPGERMQAYRCGLGWHIGHMPPIVARGLGPRPT